MLNNANNGLNLKKVDDSFPKQSEISLTWSAQTLTEKENKGFPSRYSCKEQWYPFPYFACAATLRLIYDKPELLLGMFYSGVINTFLQTISSLLSLQYNISITNLFKAPVGNFLHCFEFGAPCGQKWSVFSPWSCPVCGDYDFTYLEFS